LLRHVSAFTLYFNLAPYTRGEAPSVEILRAATAESIIATGSGSY
jgi:hypothetical protein